MENAEARVLGSLDHVVSGSIVDIAPIPSSGDRSAMTLVVSSVDWRTEWRWYFGEKQEIEPLQAGDKIYVVVDDEWAVRKGDEVTAALAMVPFNDVEGYARVILGTEALDAALVPSVDATRDLEAPAMQRYLAAAAQIDGVSLNPASGRSAQTALVMKLIADARAWLDAENLDSDGTSYPEPGGLIAQTNAVLEGGRPTPEPRVGEDDLASLPPDLRQLPFLADDVAEMSASLGVALRGIQGAVFDTAGTHTYFALRFPGVGILGPWSTDPELHYLNIVGFAPESSSAELLGWTRDDPHPELATLLGKVDLPAKWDVAMHSLVVTLNTDGTIDVELVPHIELTKQIDVLLNSRA